MWSIWFGTRKSLWIPSIWDFFLKYLNVFTQLDIQFQLDLFSSCFQVIYKCVSLCFFFSFMHFIFQVWILKSLIVTKYCEILPESFVCCGIINIRRKRGFWNKNIFLNIILQLYLIKDNKNSLKKKNHLSMWMIKLFVPWINVDNIRILAILWNSNSLNLYFPLCIPLIIARIPYT